MLITPFNNKILTHFPGQMRWLAGSCQPSRTTGTPRSGTNVCIASRTAAAGQCEGLQDTWKNSDRINKGSSDVFHSDPIFFNTLFSWLFNCPLENSWQWQMLYPSYIVSRAAPQWVGLSLTLSESIMQEGKLKNNNNLDMSLKVWGFVVL